MSGYSIQLIIGKEDQVSISVQLDTTSRGITLPCIDCQVNICLKEVKNHVLVGRENSI